MPWIRGFVWDDENVAHIARHAMSPEEVEESLTGAPLVLRGPDDRYLGYGRTENDRWVFAVYVTRPRGWIRVLTARDMTEGEAAAPPATKGAIMRRRRKMPAFRNDREAADYWGKHHSTGYAQDLPVASLKVSAALRQRVAARAKKPVTLRLEERQIAAAKRAADRLSLPYQTLLRMWIAERLAKERAG